MSIIGYIWLLIAVLIGLLVLSSGLLMWRTWDSGQAKGQAKGWLGELRTSLLHLRRLDSATYRVINDVLLPHHKRPSETTQVDHIVVSKFGVFVIETKNWGGLIYGKEHERNWTLKFGRHTTHQPRNPLGQNRGHAQAVAKFCELDEHQVHSLVFLAGKGDPVTLTEMGPNVIYRHGLAERIESFQKVVLNEADVRHCIAELSEAARQSTRARKRAHIAAVQQRHGRDRVNR